MRRPRNLVPMFMFVAALVAVVAGWELFTHTEATSYRERSAVAHSPSDIKLALQIEYDKGPIAQEIYSMRNDNGVSTSRYVVTSRGGTAITVDSTPRETYDVTFLFERAVNDGIWKISNKPPRGDTSKHYTISVYQLIAGQSGSRTVTFTDPKYWATTGGHEFKIHLDPHKPVPDLLTLQATSIQDPRFQKLIDDFTGFGLPSFKAKIAQERARLAKGA